MDKFVLVELDATQSGKEKPYYTDAFKRELTGYAEKLQILRVSIKNLHPEARGDPWQIEAFQRDAIFHQLSSSKALTSGNLIFVSDVDEIWDRNLLPQLSQASWDALKISMKHYQYFFNVRRFGSHPENTWARAFVSKGEFLQLHKPSLTDIRRRDNSLLKTASTHGWHFSSIMSAQRVLEKVLTSAHQEYNRTPYNELKYIEDCIETLRDVVSREGVELAIDPLNRFPAELVKIINNVAPNFVYRII